MANQQWLDDVERRLAESDLPPAYIRRFMDELSDHFQDFTEDAMNQKVGFESVSARLGDPEDVADTAICEFRRHSFLRRHPVAAFFVFAVSPIATMILIVGLIVLGLYGVIEIENWMGVDTDGWLRNLAHSVPRPSAVMSYLLSLLIVVIPSTLASVIYCLLARHCRIGKKWILTSCIVLAIVASLLVCNAKISEIPGKSLLGIGVRVPFGLKDFWSDFWGLFCSPRQLLQVLSPLAIGSWFLWRMRKPQCECDKSARIAA
jgi:hypothetical protein